MPNQKSSKGKKSRRTNSSGDEQENGACAAAAAAAAAAGGAAAAAAAAAPPGSDASSEGQCATPLGCSMGRPIDLEKDDYQRVLCNNELCPHGNWMHLQCFYEWESSILVQFNCIGRARSWNEKQCRQNMWTKKGYDLAFRFCSCRCGQGHLKKDTDWYQVKRMQDERKKKPPERSAARSGSTGGGDGFYEEPKKSKTSGGKAAQRASSQDLPRRQSVERQSSAERGAGPGACDSPGQSPPFSLSPTALLVSGPGAFRGSRQLGEFLKSAVHMEAQKKQQLLSRAAGGAHLDPGAVLPLSFALPLHHRLAPGSLSDGPLPHPVQFLRRLDLSELLTHVPRHKLNTYHVRMEDDAQAGQGEELRRFILSALSASQRNVLNCALCHRALPVFEQFPLVDGTLFLSPSRHEEIDYDVPCHLQGAPQLQTLREAGGGRPRGDAVLLRVQQRAAVSALREPGLSLRQALLLLQGSGGLLTNAAPACCSPLPPVSLGLTLRRGHGFSMFRVPSRSVTSECIGLPKQLLFFTKNTKPWTLE
ncbi:headcase protein homolog isoform X1 [Synchiropus splendidus]|uniref:headcase protein homolog isoform X1 n=1 Tax=Synchiropus splendidus TaxID=270530 RepID=UPI00237D76B8|nr:headcase protein homolog isoform X1 [Synchiropus splendidus]